MKTLLAISAIILTFSVYDCAQTNSAASAPAVPPWIRFSASLPAANATIGVNFALYKDQSGGAPLWVETQNVMVDGTGRYSVNLGENHAEGISPELFAAGEARWLGVQPDGQSELPRVLLFSVPYAMKAANADTIGGLPPSAFVLAQPQLGGGTSPSAESRLGAEPASHAAASDVTTSGGSVNAVPLFTTATNIQNSLLTQTGATAVNVAGTLSLPALGTATSTTGYNSEPQNFVASSFNSSTSSAVAQTFEWRAEPVNNDTTTASGALSLLYASGSSSLVETGLKLGSNGLITFATGQKFPGTGTGTITGVTAGADLTGGGTSGTVTVSVDTTKVPTLAATSNTFTGAISASHFISTVATGTAPLSVNSTTVVPNLNAALLGGLAATAFPTLSAATNTFTGSITAASFKGSGASLTSLPATALTGTVAMANGGTGVTSSGSAGEYLRSNGTSWAVSKIQASDLPSGFITGVTAGTDLTGGGTSGTVTVNLDTTKVPTLAATSNVFAGSITAPSFSGSGASLTALNAGNVSAGTLAMGNGGTGVTSSGSAGEYLRSNGKSWAVSAIQASDLPAGTGTITGVTAGTDLTGGGATGTVTINLNTSLVPTLAGLNSFTNYQQVVASEPGYVVGAQNNYATGGNGVEGLSNGTNGTGVYGEADNGASSSGLYGKSTTGIGSRGVFGTTSTLGAGLGNVLTGMWADTASGNQAMLATADNANAAVALNNSTLTTFYAENEYTAAEEVVLYATGEVSGDACEMTTLGNLICAGAISGVSKTPDRRALQTYTMQSPQNWYEDFGAGTLSHGVATVTLDPDFAALANTDTNYHVFLTPNGDCKGLFVSEKTATAFEVRELGGGASSVGFDYRIVAGRRGMESVRMPDVTDRINAHAAARPMHRQGVDASALRLEENGAPRQ